MFKLYNSRLGLKLSAECDIPRSICAAGDFNPQPHIELQQQLKPLLAAGLVPTDGLEELLGQKMMADPFGHAPASCLLARQNCQRAVWVLCGLVGGNHGQLDVVPKPTYMMHVGCP